MAKTKIKSQSSERSRKRKTSSQNKTSLQSSSEKSQTLMRQAISLLHTGQPDEALSLAKKALACLQLSLVTPKDQVPVLEVLGEIYLELGDTGAAQEAFLQAADLDPGGIYSETEASGADKFLWLAQLCEEGGQQSVMWFEKGCAALRSSLNRYQESTAGREELESIEMCKHKLANALCGAAEVYMTDLSWEEDAEVRCEALVTEACLLAPLSPEPLQTLASVRISQKRMDDARSALSRSMDLWTDLQPGDPEVPEFSTRISLSRLLMEVEMEEKGLEVLERLVAEDDSSVEAWYLGGWCQYLMATKHQTEVNSITTELNLTSTNGAKQLFRSSKDWLDNSLREYKKLDYEDVRLKEHALELVAGLDEILGPHSQNNEDREEEEDEKEDDWEDAQDGSDVDDTMTGTYE